MSRYNGTATPTHNEAWSKALGDSPINVEIGDVDGDGALETVVSTWGDNSVRVYGADGALERARAFIIAYDSELKAITLADMDGDGVLDIVVTGHYGGIAVLRGSDLTTIWGSTTPHYSNVGTGDTDGNGTLEIASGDYESQRHMRLVNGQTGALIWSVNISGTAYNTPLIADVTGDSEKEIVFSSHNGSAAERVFALRASNGATLWTFDMPSYGYISAQWADFDNDGNNEILIGCDEAIYLLTGAGAQKWVYNTGQDSYSGHYNWVVDAVHGDVNADGIREIFFSISAGDDASKDGLYAIKGSDGSLLWKRNFVSTSYARDGTPSLADVDNDGVQEVVWTYSKLDESLSFVESYVEVVRATDGALLWGYKFDIAQTRMMRADIAPMSGKKDIALIDFFRNLLRMLR